ncbi:MAG: serine/threonine protein kinase, partial [Deltaproteobacteria bacterium]|nr:serine/threonine protein kinase [Deltaproteobacteria bacterium]
STLPFAAHQAGAFVGLTASHKLEEHWGLRPRVEGSTFLLDTFVSLVSLGIGAHLGQRALGERFAEFRSELGMAAKLQKYRPQENARARLVPAMAGGDGRGLSPILMMSMSMPPGGPKGGRPSKGTSWQESQVPEPSDPLNGHISVTPADVVPKPPTEPPDPNIGKVFEGRYRIKRKIGYGGMGVVYEATHEVIGKRMALKLLRRDAMTKEVAERFLNEAKAAGMIGNPHIIEVTDFGKLADGTPYFVMEYLEGTSLFGLMEGYQPVPIPRLVNIARQIAEGLADAHKAGIVHRDIKPENIFLINEGSKVDFVKILDFGIAKIANGGSGEKLTQAGVPFGTPQYMSPEQSAGLPGIDHRTDVYAFGMLLYEMATGRLPFNFENFQETLNAQMYKPPIPPSELVPVKQPIPPGLEAIIMKAISKRPENRYQSMGEIIVELDKVQSGLMPAAVTELKKRSESADLPLDYFRNGFTPTNLRRSRRWPIFAGIGIGGASALAAAFYALSRTGGVTAQPTAVPPPDDKPKPDAAPVDTAPTEPSPKRQVEVNVDPVDARVFRNGEDLGNNVVKVEMDPGQKVELEVKREGYKSRKITLDGLEESVTVKLEKEKAVRPRPSGNPSGSGKPKPKPTNSGEVISPWK